MSRARCPLLSIALIAALALIGCREFESDGFEALQADFPALEFELPGPAGGPVRATELDASAILVLFGFTRCSGTCPTILWRLTQALDSLPEGDRERVRVVFVGIDHDRDSPTDVSRYAASFDPRFVGVSGDASALDHLGRRMGVSAYISDQRRDRPVQVNHSTRLFLFDGHRQARYLIQSNVSTELLSDLLSEVLHST